MNKRTTIRLPEELLRRARKKAAAEGSTLTELIEDGLRSVVSGKAEPARVKPVRLPVSTATGGFKPPFAELTFSEIEELDDLEYIERMKNFR